MTDYKAIQITDENISSLDKLDLEATAEGYYSVRKTIDEWVSGVNDFSKQGEKFWGIFVLGECVAIGGLNIDQYVDDKNIGRVRHIYVSQKYRRQGLAKLLVNMIIQEARKNFTTLRLFTSNPIAALAYESMGFKKSNEYKATHILDLKKL